MLAERDLVPYLLRRELISARSVVEGDLTVLDASRRNHNFGILRRRGLSYLLKQGTDPERNASIANEAKVYQFFYSDAESDKFTRYLPRYFGYDPDKHVLLVEFLTDVEDLQKYHARCGRFSTKIAASMGDALSLLHRKSWTNGKGSGHIFMCPPPWVFSIHHPDVGILQGMSEANIQVIKIVQQYPEFCGLLDELRKGWKAEAFIHSDLKWDNCLLSVASGKITLKIVDWELAGLGDPSWDVGSILSAYLSFWLLFVPITTETHPSQSLRLARYPLERMQPALRAFWRSYVRGMQLDPVRAEQLLVRAVKYGAARLAQTSYEQMQASPQLIGNVVCSLQLSLNILKRPKEASRDLVGIPLLSN
jgi:hypothetical protein